MLTKMTRRSALGLLGAGLAVGQTDRDLFQPTWESLKQYKCPDWFRDVKFGIWAHWGPQCAPRQGDWYARNLYIQGTRQYEYHVKHYGHPSKVGYKDVIPLWKAEHWEPETLIRKYKNAGAKYFVSLGVHCDNFDCWNSRYHQWNAVNYGPKKDIVGTWRDIARANGLRFGVSEHLAWSYSWFNVNKDSDKTGPLAGVPYDGNDSAYWDLYFPPHKEKEAQFTQNAPEFWKDNWLIRVRDLFDQHQPDLVYTDGGAFDQVGLDAIAYYYNANTRWHGGKLDSVYTIKNHLASTKLMGDYQEGAATLDIERGAATDIRSEPWQTDTCIGQWFYFDGFKYKTPGEVVRYFVDVVSKNGTLLLNFPLLPDGSLDSQSESILADITKWMAVNGECLHASRPWKKFGEGPARAEGGLFSERKMKPFTAADVRFISKSDKLYVFFLGLPEADPIIKSLAKSEGLWTRPVSRVRVIGSDEGVKWSLDAGGLRIQRPNHNPSDLTLGFEIS
ncbi:MAG TPA: alpha-L-fucosidase [Bryobacteraceae bacterium]